VGESLDILDLFWILVLGSLWGGSFLFIRIAAPVLGPFDLMELRVGIAAVILSLIAWRMRTLKFSRRTFFHMLGVGALNAAIPFVLIATAELQLASGLSSILNATTPLFSMIVSAVVLKETITPSKLLGILTGIAGVWLLTAMGSGTDGDSNNGASSQWLYIACSLGAAFFYSIGTVYAKFVTQGMHPLTAAFGQQLGAALVLLPFSVGFLPHTLPNISVILATLALAVLCTALAYIIYFRLLARVGPTNSLTVTFLVPGFGIIWGALFLKESISVNEILGLLVISMSIVLVTGIWQRFLPMQKHS
jgi:drug/metabolite transporter (DMT)-like permease